jgi:hypothetical protein
MIHEPLWAEKKKNKKKKKKQRPTGGNDTIGDHCAALAPALAPPASNGYLLPQKSSIAKRVNASRGFGCQGLGFRIQSLGFRV